MLNIFLCKNSKLKNAHQNIGISKKMMSILIMCYSATSTTIGQSTSISVSPPIAALSVPETLVGS